MQHLLNLWSRKNHHPQRSFLRGAAVLSIIGAMVSCAGADGEPGKTYTMLVADSGVELAPPLGVGREQPDMQSNTWYDYDFIDLEDTFIYSGVAYNASFQIEMDGEVSSTAFEAGADGQDFYLVQYGSTSGYVMYIFTERFEPSSGPETDPIALLSLDRPSPFSLESVDLTSVPFGEPAVIPFADDIPDTDGDGNGDILDFSVTEEYLLGSRDGLDSGYQSESYRWLIDDARLDGVPGEFVYLTWILRKRALP